jgi:5-methylcytosine-specific restriction endonuclease McrA
VNGNHKFKLKYAKFISTIKHCAYCGIEDNGLHLDHVYPRSKGGKLTLENTAMCCIRCNSTKSTNDIDQFRDVAIRRMAQHMREYEYYQAILESINRNNFTLSNILNNG